MMKHFSSIAAALCLTSSFSHAADWPQWMGPNRNDVWSETGIVQTFPAEGLKPRWRKSIHGGFAGPAVASGRVFVTDYVLMAGDAKPHPTKRSTLEGKERVLCLHADTGEELWKHEYACNYDISYPAGPRCTPTVDGDKVYTLGAMGDLLCLNAVSGRVIWSKNLPRDYSASVPIWGYAGHPLIYKNLLICMAGGEGSAVIALDKTTGKEVWKSLTTAQLGYSPPTLIDAGGTTQLLIFHGTALNSLNPDNGQLHWSEPLGTAYAMSIMSPRRWEDYLFAGGHSNKSIGLKLDATKPAVTRVWQGSRTLGLAPVNGTPFVENGVAYGIDGDGLFRAVRITTGERLWETSLPVTGKENDPRRAVEGGTFVTKNEDRFFIFGENGDLIIAQLTPEKYVELSRAHLLAPVGKALGRSIVWCHPAYANRCVFARNDQEIVCVSLAAEK
ncbi:MAG: PQQ-binding-like beta-propeller repeat protein [Verrucomicrobiaceae bacterium]|nr:PQQ-binding-like beta-propeller repeat protein [Verrucomicrobiaceae bacterium]